MQEDDVPTVRDLYAPRSVAVIGASAAPNAVTSRPLRFLKRHAFPGRIYAVNPRYDRIDDIACFASVGAVPETPDVAMIGLPADRVVDAVADCCARGVPLICIFSAALDPDAKARIVALARDSGCRILGPNSLGFINTHAAAACTYSQAALLETLPSGALSIISQSGGLGGCLLNRAVDEGIGIARFLTPGSGVDIDLTELLEELASCDDTRAVAAIVESISDGPRFNRAVARLHAAGKRLVVYRIGRSASGRSMTVSHTGALGSDAHIFAAICRTLGVPVAHSLDQLLEVATACVAPRPPVGPSIGVMTSSGGAAIVVADALEDRGLTMPPLSPALADRLRNSLSAAATIDNPLDIGAGQSSKAFRAALDAMLSEPAFNSVIIALTMVAGEQAEDVVPALIEAGRQAERPLAVIWPAGSLAAPWRRKMRESGIPVFESPDHAAMALCELPLRPTAVVSDRPEVSTLAGQAHATIGKAAGVRTEWQTRKLLAVYGIESPIEVLATTREEAVAAAQRIGFPVAMKVQSPALPHRAAAGALKLNVADAHAVADAYDGFRARFNKEHVEGILVQEMIRLEHELLVGIVDDCAFGPVIAFGEGGADVENRQNIIFALPGRSKDAFIALLRSHPLCARIGDIGIATIADLMVRLSQLVIDLGCRLAELDINPVALVEGGRRALAVDALARITDASVAGPDLPVRDASVRLAPTGAIS